MRIPKKYQPMIESVEWESFENHYWVELEDDYTMDGAHCFAEDTLKEVWETMERVEEAEA